MRPSGMSCKAMDEVTSQPRPVEVAKADAIASPSGMLCRVMVPTSSVTFLLASGMLDPQIIMWACGSARSSTTNARSPTRKLTSAARCPDRACDSSAISSAEKAIIPAQNAIA
jgi:hypothetical protein